MGEQKLEPGQKVEAFRQQGRWISGKSRWVSGEIVKVCPKKVLVRSGEEEFFVNIENIRSIREGTA